MFTDSASESTWHEGAEAPRSAFGGPVQSDGSLAAWCITTKPGNIEHSLVEVLQDIFM